MTKKKTFIENNHKKSAIKSYEQKNALKNTNSTLDGKFTQDC